MGEVQKELQLYQKDVNEQFAAEEQRTEELERLISRTQRQIEEKNKEIQEVRIENEYFRRNQGSTALENEKNKRDSQQYKVLSEDLQNQLEKQATIIAQRNQQIQQLQNLIHSDSVARSDDQSTIAYLRAQIEDQRQTIVSKSRQFQEEIDQKDKQLEYTRHQYDHSVDKIIGQTYRVDGLSDKSDIRKENRRWQGSNQFQKLTGSKSTVSLVPQEYEENNNSGYRRLSPHNMSNISSTPRNIKRNFVPPSTVQKRDYHPAGSHVSAAYPDPFIHKIKEVSQYQLFDCVKSNLNK